MTHSLFPNSGVNDYRHWTIVDKGNLHISAEYPSADRLADRRRDLLAVLFVQRDSDVVACGPNI